MLYRQWLMFSALFGFFGVCLGAFGGHVLKKVIPEESFSIYQVGVFYHLIHTLALFGVGLLAAQSPSLDTRVAGWAFTLGILLFSGSLYVLSLTRVDALGFITPIGGVVLLLGWTSLGLSIWRV